MNSIAATVRAQASQAARQAARQNEAIVRGMLERWVSELEPAVVLDPRGKIIGLTHVGFEVGQKPTIVVSADKQP